MPCNLTQSMPLDCKDSVGGLKEVLFIEFDNVTAINETSGIVSGITVASGKQFRRYQLPKETASATETLNSNVQNGTLYYQQELVVVINKMTANNRNEVQLLAQNRLIAITLDKNGKYFLYGREGGLEASAGDGGSGTAHGDRNGYSRTFQGMEKFLAPEVQSSIIAALLTPAS